MTTLWGYQSPHVMARLFLRIPRWKVVDCRRTKKRLILSHSRLIKVPQPDGRSMVIILGALSRADRQIASTPSTTLTAGSSSSITRASPEDDIPPQHTASPSSNGFIVKVFHPICLIYWSFFILYSTLLRICEPVLVWLQKKPWEILKLTIEAIRIVLYSFWSILYLIWWIIYYLHIAILEIVTFPFNVVRVGCIYIAKIWYCFRAGLIEVIVVYVWRRNSVVAIQVTTRNVTILFQDDSDDLGVADMSFSAIEASTELEKTERFRHVDPKSGTIVINVEYLLMRWSNERWKTTVHRVSESLFQWKEKRWNFTVLTIHTVPR